MKLRAPLAVLALAATVPALAQTTVQQDFEAAAKLDATGDNAAALAAWVRLEARTKPNSRSRAIVLVRKSAALLALGRRDDAVAAAREGLKDLPESDPTLRADRYQAHFNLARVARDSLDYATAVDEFARAEALAAIPLDTYLAVYGLAETQTFVDTNAAARSLARLEALSATMKVEPKAAARQRQLHAQLALNRGDFPGAAREAKTAVKLLGGLTPRTDLFDVSARSDAALALLLSGDADQARQYMAMTGAGRIPNGSFDPGVQMVAPPCGGEADLKAADLAVVEFTVDDDGGVTNSRPVYAAGGGQVALEFARVARGWSWTAEQAKALPPFFRNGVRVEMRCSVAFERPSISSFMTEELSRWLRDHGSSEQASPTIGDARTLAADRAAVAAASRPIERAYARTKLARNAALPRDERGAVALQAVGDLRALGAPPIALLPLEIIIREARSAERRWGDSARLVRPLLATTPYAGNPLARATLHLYVADSLPPRSIDEIRGLLRLVADEPTLPASHDLKVGALIRLASLEQRAGAPADARAAYAESGLSAAQCAILDAPPKQLRAGGKFPYEALRWGFEGWAQVQFDITAAGLVRGERVILAYPPFVFSKAGAQTLATARYAESYRPDGGPGCNAETGRVRFVLGS